MAHGVTAREGRKLHQALHGYVDGHRQLALSAGLKAGDQRTLLALSDISGPGAGLDDGGYLTGYPLPDSGMFALARTWPAPEMPRPGCVWTHTLLIDFDDLAEMRSLTELASFFRRPSSIGEAQSYARPEPAPVRLSEPHFFGAQIWARRVLAALYGEAKSPIIAGNPGPDRDFVVLALWSQQWPRLRRSFRFCTFAAEDRSIEGAGFDLQVLPPRDRSFRSRFRAVFDADSASQGPAAWVDLALKDLEQPDVDGLRTFLRTLGSDASGGREAFRPLCGLHQAMRGLNEDPNALQTAIAILRDEVGLKDARRAKVVVASAALDHADVLDEPSFDFLWNQLSLLEPPALAKQAGRLGRAVWRRDPTRLVRLALDPSHFQPIIDRTFLDLDINELLDGLERVPELAGKALACRPELVERPKFWSRAGAIDEALDAGAIASRQTAVARAMLVAGRDDLASRAVPLLGAIPVLTALNAVADEKRMSLWVHAVVHDIDAVAGFLAGDSQIRRRLLYDLARNLPPDALPNDRGVDPWVAAWNRSIDGIERVAADYVAAYLLSRALGSRSRSAAELAELSFEKTHISAASNILPDAAWRLLDPRLPPSAFWFDWDRCQRLRTGVVKLFVERDLPPAAFARLATDERLFEMLASQAARSNRGRGYLKHVRAAIEDSTDPWRDGRLQAIESVLD
jgi:hypothetical protein